VSLLNQLPYQFLFTDVVMQGQAVDLEDGMWQKLLQAAIMARHQDPSGQDLVERAKAVGLHISGVLNVDTYGHICKLLVVFAEHRLWTASEWS
jgi:hypothetical protein